MRKNVFGRQFKRDANERKALFKNLLTSLVLEERIKTTQAKAKAIKGAADKLVTKAKKHDAMRRLAPDVNHDAVTKLVNDIAPRFASRQGGYTRIIKVGNRIADNAEMVIMEWTEKGAITPVASKKGKKKIKAAKKGDTMKAEAKVTKPAKKEAKEKKEDKEKKKTAAKKETKKKEAKKK